MFLKYICLLVVVFPISVLAIELTPKLVLETVYKNNPALASSKAIVESEKTAISSQYSLSGPRLGLMKESDMNTMQMKDGPMKTWSISQDIMFPTKYFSRGDIQKTRFKKNQEEYEDKRLELRSEALSVYFRYYTFKRIYSLLKAQKETLREIARIAENRRSTGVVPQQDEMKAHVEQTKIENELLLMAQEYAEAGYTLNAILNRPIESEINLPEKDFNLQADFKLVSDFEELNIHRSNLIKSEEYSVEQAGLEKDLAKMGYLPDFMLTYKKAYGGNAISTAEAFGIEMTIPLWFLKKERSEVGAATLKEFAAKRKLESVKRNIESSVRILKSKVITYSKLLQIFETALIPQATSTLNSSRSAYSTGKVGFQELLDAERTLYSTRIEYYQNFSKYIDAVTGLERVAGISVSGLPFSEEDI